MTVSVGWGWMQWALMLLCLILLVVAYSLIFLSTVRHRRRSPQAKRWRDSRLADVVWTLVPLVFVGALLWPMLKPVWQAESSGDIRSQALVHRASGSADCGLIAPANAVPE
ncbi:cytochrome c oxidase subunit II transmembrane domain-containing protein [Lampropedia puyangensis]|nr:cytochrome c oxidase subunit II transmembrane domain-containing protein [Lampropedia puyangensis]